MCIACCVCRVVDLMYFFSFLDFALDWVLVESGKAIYRYVLSSVVKPDMN